MNIAQTIYQHVKSKSIEVLHFVEFLETKQDAIADNADENEVLEFMQSLPIGKRSDAEINNDFQKLRSDN